MSKRERDGCLEGLKEVKAMRGVKLAENRITSKLINRLGLRETTIGYSEWGTFVSARLEERRR